MKVAPRIALFIDAENITSSKVVGILVSLLNECGNLTVRIAYGKGTPPGWDAEFLRKHALEFKRVPPVTPSKKNDIVDKQLIVAAMANFLDRGIPDVLAIVAGDADYTALVRDARGRVSEVWGFANTANSGADFRREFTRFFPLDNIKESGGEGKLRADMERAAAEVRSLVSVKKNPQEVDLDGVGRVLIDALKRDNHRLDYNNPELNRLVDNDRGKLFHALTTISEDSNRRNGVFLSAVVVSAKSGVPGEGFFGMAKRCGRVFDDGDKADKERLWVEELVKARYWARKQG